MKGREGRRRRRRGRRRWARARGRALGEARCETREGLMLAAPLLQPYPSAAGTRSAPVFVCRWPLGSGCFPSSLYFKALW